MICKKLYFQLIEFISKLFKNLKKIKYIIKL